MCLRTESVARQDNAEKCCSGHWRRVLVFAAEHIRNSALARSSVEHGRKCRTIKLSRAAGDGRCRSELSLAAAHHA